MKNWSAVFRVKVTVKVTHFHWMFVSPVFTVKTNVVVFMCYYNKQTICKQNGHNWHSHLWCLGTQLWIFCCTGREAFFVSFIFISSLAVNQPTWPQSLFFLLCLPKPLVAVTKHVLLTDILSDANMNRILARLVTLIPMLCTISSIVLCLKFGGVWETLWIFKLWWIHKINSPTVGNGIRALSLEIQAANFAKLP